ncbi:hypothetical protein [Pseudoalteromonas luteoviolacea]|uniref:Uncharacterized protein n=1 Tax=Pseudoalteromonas luteoviolacea S4054 TaxID=1129367 RepID=A0A0F6A896_9GAMM|nr:hypothetical protein [Pseudoalteromonas luteoviolacea]KKE82338.1 hypothetical protein N479_19045 [Pseudoalteromonas luteoviolacea S4054]KZN78990.1 hypothetical protein N481_00675 [Pseudoalteromonas luteoviolacea S4047-1]AOT07846.1 hypothetical protein S4054249_08325 [Pseudoalteromonas luteoviolacea]AOT12762.1 hypothetical protein S40542_08325 [Pseudoalteromonas luteoviolacea]AOT17675.1 hypothetical protein S4054_08320 [Pseudoalteromonas luteoviolacea]
MAKYSSVFSRLKPVLFILIIGIAIYFGIHYIGESLVVHMDSLESHNHISEVLTNKLLRKYDKLAFGALIAFVFIAIKRFWKDSRR